MSELNSQPKVGPFEAARQSLIRFPGVMAMAALATGLVIQNSFRAPDIHSYSHWRSLLIAVLGIPWFYSLTLLAERRWKSVARFAVPLLVGATTLGLYYFRLISLGDELFSEAFIIEYVSIFIALHLFAAYAPFIGIQQPRAFWEYNRRIFVRFLTALLFSATLYLGIFLLLAALSKLFKLSLLEFLLFVTGALIAGIFNTWFFLSGVPEDFDSLEREPPPYPRGLKAFAQYLLMPLVLAIGVVLELWLLQRLLSGKTLDAVSAGAFFALGAVGLLTYLLLYPLRKDHRWLKIYENGFFLALLPMMAATLFSVLGLLRHYGLTPLRYYSLLLSGWGLLLALYFLLSRKPGIRWIPISLSLVAVLSLGGPWGAYSASRRSQIGRLVLYLGEQGIQPGEDTTQDLLKIPAEAKNRLLGKIGYIEDHYGCEALRPFFGKQLAVPACDTRQLRRILTRDSELPAENFTIEEPVAINFLGDRPSYEEVPVAGFEYYFPDSAVKFLEGGQPSSKCPSGPYETPVCAVLPEEGQQMELFLRGRSIGFVDLRSIYLGLLAKYDKAADVSPDSSHVYDLSPKELTFDAKTKAGKIRLQFGQIRLERRGEKVFPDYLRFSLLFKEGT